MHNIDKGAVEECMYEFAVWMWQRDLKVTELEIEDFFRERGTTRHEAVAAANYHNIVITSATFEDSIRPPAFVRFIKWIWK